MVLKLSLVLLVFSTQVLALNVAVVGAGASGLTAAHFLEKQGHQVTVFEKHDRVGGKVFSIDVDGTTVELGGILVTPRYSVVDELAGIYGPTPVTCPTELFFLDQSHSWKKYKGFSAIGPLRTLVQYKRLVDTFRRFPELKAQELQVRMHPDLFLPLNEFARKFGFLELLPPLVMGLTGSGYLFLENVPAFYALKLFSLIGPTGLQGYIDHLIPFHGPYLRGLRFFKKGFSKLWENVAQGLDVRLNEEVLTIAPGQLTTPKGTYQFDRIVVSTDLMTAKSMLGTTSAELTLLSQEMKPSRFLVTVIKTRGLPNSSHKSFYFYPNMTLTKINHLQSMVNYWDDSSLYVAYQILDDSIDWKESEKILREDLFQSLNIRFEVVKKIEWSYFHHFKVGGLTYAISQALANFQGQNGIYFVGESLNFETVEHAAANAKWIIQHHFD